MESGSDEVLKRCHKGISSSEMLNIFHRLDRLGISYSLSSISGLGGRRYSREHALSTASLYSKTHPRTIRIMSLIPWPGTPLYDEIAKGEFEELPPWEILQEERLFLEHLDVGPCLFLANHISNEIPLFGLLPEHKEMMLAILDDVLNTLDPKLLTRRSFEHM